MRLHRRVTWPLLAAAALGGCAATEIEMPPVAADAPLPVGEYADAERAGAAVYRIDPARSLLLFRVGRDGPMKHLGHDHVIASEDVEGFVLVADDTSESRADLAVPLAKLVVDKARYRERYGLDPDVGESAIAGTYNNMQQKVLESSVYPWAVVSARYADAAVPTLAVSVTLHGATHEYLVPVELDVAEGEVRVSGAMTLAHADFGLEPYTAGGGMLRVAAGIDLEFSLVGVR